MKTTQHSWPVTTTDQLSLHWKLYIYMHCTATECDPPGTSLTHLAAIKINESGFQTLLCKLVQRPVHWYRMCLLSLCPLLSLLPSLPGLSSPEQLRTGSVGTALCIGKDVSALLSLPLPSSAHSFPVLNATSKQPRTGTALCIGKDVSALLSLPTFLCSLFPCPQCH